MVLFESLLFLAGLVVLLRSSDVFVESAVKISKLLGISAFVIGLTVVAIGTSVPELATSIVASLKGTEGIVVGTIVGSNIANIGLILSLAVFLGGTILIDRKIFEKDLFVMLVVSVIFFYFMADGAVSFPEGLFLLFFFIAYTVFLFRSDSGRKNFFDFESYLKSFYGVSSFLLSWSVYKEIIRQGLDPKTYLALLKDEPELFEQKEIVTKGFSQSEEFRQEYKKEVLSHTVKNFLLLFFSLAGLWIGSDLTVNGAVFLAVLLGVHTELISLTVIAVGTSLPELSVSLAAVKKATPRILLGNIIGSNIANILLIGGISALIAPVSSTRGLVFAPLVLMLVLAFLLWLSFFGRFRLNRFFAVIFFAVYLVFLYALVTGVTAF